MAETSNLPIQELRTSTSAAYAVGLLNSACEWEAHNNKFNFYIHNSRDAFVTQLKQTEYITDKNKELESKKKSSVSEVLKFIDYSIQGPHTSFKEMNLGDKFISKLLSVKKHLPIVITKFLEQTLEQCSQNKLNKEEYNILQRATTDIIRMFSPQNGIDPRKSGENYYHHIFHVAFLAMRSGITDIYDIVALMYHDALEDAPEFKDLKTSEDKKTALKEHLKNNIFNGKEKSSIKHTNILNEKLDKIATIVDAMSHYKTPEKTTENKYKFKSLDHIKKIAALGPEYNAALIGKMCDHTQNLMTCNNRDWNYKLRMIEATENFYLPLAITLGENTKELALNMSNIIEGIKSNLLNTFDITNEKIYLKNTKKEISQENLQSKQTKWDDNHLPYRKNQILNIKASYAPYIEASKLLSYINQHPKLWDDNLIIDLRETTRSFMQKRDDKQKTIFTYDTSRKEDYLRMDLNTHNTGKKDEFYLKIIQQGLSKKNQSNVIINEILRVLKHATKHLGEEPSSEEIKKIFMEFLETRIQYNIDGKTFILPQINSAVDAMVDYMFKRNDLNKQNIRNQFSRRVFYDKNGRKLSIFEIIEEKKSYSSSTVDEQSQVNWMSLWSCAGSSVSKLHLAEQITSEGFDEFITTLIKQDLIAKNKQGYKKNLRNFEKTLPLEKPSKKAEFLKKHRTFLDQYIKIPEHISFRASNLQLNLAEAHDEKYIKSPLRKIIPNCSIYEDQEKTGFYKVSIPDGTTKKQVIQAALFLEDSGRI